MDICVSCGSQIRLSIFWKGWTHSSTGDPKCENTNQTAALQLKNQEA